jgi:hypothetical protein
MGKHLSRKSKVHHHYCFSFFFTFDLFFLPCVPSHPADLDKIRRDVSRMKFELTIYSSPKLIQNIRHLEKQLADGDMKRSGAKGYLKIERSSNGSILGKYIHLKCYHTKYYSKGNKSPRNKVCDCLRDGNDFDLSEKSKKLQDDHRLVIDTSFADMQLATVAGLEKREFAPNLFFGRGHP